MAPEVAGSNPVIHPNPSQPDIPGRGIHHAPLCRMAHNEDDRNTEPPDEDAPAQRDVEPRITGRITDIDPSPEGRMMQVETIETPDTSNPGGVTRSQDIDDRAADEARMQVRRQEHSAD